MKEVSPDEPLQKIAVLLCALILCLSCTCCFAEEETVTVPGVIGMEVNPVEIPETAAAE